MACIVRNEGNNSAIKKETNARMEEMRVTGQSGVMDD